MASAGILFNVLTAYTDDRFTATTVPGQFAAWAAPVRRGRIYEWGDVGSRRLRTDGLGHSASIVQPARLLTFQTSVLFPVRRAPGLIERASIG